MLPRLAHAGSYLLLVYSNGQTTNMKKSKLLSRKEIIRIVEYMVSGGAYFWTGYGVFFLADKVLHLNLWWAKLAANIR